MGVGIRLKEILRDKGITIKQLSIDSGISLNTLYSITKRDSERVDDIVLKRIANTLGIPKSYLTGEAVAEITFNATPDPEWAALYHKLETGTITPDELQRWKELEAQASANTQRALAAMMERLRVQMDKLNPAGQQVAVERLEELTKIPDYRKTEDK